MSRSTKDVTVKRDPETRTTETRTRPFAGVLIVGLFGVPALVIVLRAFLYFDPELKFLAVVLTMFLFGTCGPAAAIGIGYKVTKRIPWVIWHVVLTIEAFALAVSLGMVLGWNRAGQPWWSRWLDIVTVPSSAALTYLLFAVFLAGSWLLYRINAFRAATGAGGDGDGGLAELLKWPTAAKVRAGSIAADEHAVTATIDHPGVPVREVQGALAAVVEQSGAIRGRSSVIPGEKGGVSEIRLVKSDPLQEWRPWPGLSHPGGSFAHPFRTAYYVNGQTQWYSFAKTPRSEILPPSQVAPKFRSANDASFGRQGATRAGKSGDNAIEIAEACSRRDCIPIFVNAAKLMQDVGWALDFAGLAADTKDNAQMLFAAVRKIGEHRSAVMGDPRLQGRHRTWTPATFRELGFAALLIEVDEGDQVLNSGIATWLATKGLSLGIYSSVMISRAATDGMAATLRSAITQWKAFGAGQAYDGGFVISDEVIRAGADVGALSTKFPGSHYMDHAQGVDSSLYPELARSYQTAEDFSDLRRAVEAARATFTPATFTPGELKVLGDAATLLAPRTILFGAFAKADGTTPDGGVPAGDTTEGIDMQDTQTLDDIGDTGDPELDELLAKPRPDFTELEREYGPLPPVGEKFPPEREVGDPTAELETDRPEWSREQTDAEFNAALVRLAKRGLTEIGNKDVMDEMRCDPNPTYVSRRFKGLCDEGKYAGPPNVTLERVPGRAGRYLITWLAPGGVPGGDAHPE